MFSGYIRSWEEVPASHCIHQLRMLASCRPVPFPPVVQLPKELDIRKGARSPSQAGQERSGGKESKDKIYIIDYITIC